MNRETIIAEIKRIAGENGGVPPGKAHFARSTGITEGQWRGKYWLRWSDLVADAGFVAGRMQEAHESEFLLKALARLTLEIGHFPTISEVVMARTKDQSFPSEKTFRRFGSREERIEALRGFSERNAEFSTVRNLLPAAKEVTVIDTSVESVPDLGNEGYVYMLKLGKYYKIGKTFAVPRRHREIALELPEKPDVVHSIQTDDPDGIEAYWHRRFQRLRTNGEWFALSGADVKAFKRRKFM